MIADLTGDIPALTIGGSDNSGGAGIQVDIKTFTALGCYGLSAITAVTAQTAMEFLSFKPVDPGLVYDQISMSVRQQKPIAVKTGMIGSTENIRTIARAIRDFGLGRLVIDPVMKSSAGPVLQTETPDKPARFIEVLKNDLLPLALVVTPNRPEAEALTGLSLNSPDSLDLAGRMILDMGPQYVIIKGGHIEFEPGTSRDIIYTRKGKTEIEGPRIPNQNFHGTGCAFSAALCACLARGLNVETAARNAKRFVFCAMKQENPAYPGILNLSCNFNIED